MRQGSAMVAVMVMVLVLAALGATLMTGAQGTRRKTQKVGENLQRELVLDAAFVHGFHALKDAVIDPDSGLASLQVSDGQGSLADIPYQFNLTPEVETSSVRIDATAGTKPELKGYAVAYLKLTKDEKRTHQRWSIRYFGPE